MRDSRRYLGLELAGAKNSKTAMAALEYYPKERKTFLLDIYERIAGQASGAGAPTGGTSRAHTAVAHAESDTALLELVAELTEEIEPEKVRLGVNVPLELPPCVDCSKRICPQAAKCSVPAVRWMREITRKQAKAHLADEAHLRTLEFTPYTQRPVELWLRYQVLSKLPESHRFEIDETLGGNKAPLAMRMHYLKRHLPKISVVEVSPKLSVAILALELGLTKRVVSSYRRLEEGAHAREEILEALAERFGIFIYERDARKLSHNLSSFDAFICAFTALLSDLNLCAKVPHGFPARSGWVHYPRSETIS